MFNFYYIIKKDIKEHNPNWPKIPGHPYRTLIVGGSGSGKTDVLINLINHEPDINKIYLYAKDLYESKHQSLVNKIESTDIKYLNDSEAIIEHSNYMDDIYKILKNTNQMKMIPNMLSNTKLNPIETELFIRGKKTNIYLVFITQSYFVVLKNVSLNSTHYFIMKVPNKRELQQIAFNHLSDMDFQDCMNLSKKCAAKPYSFVVINTTLASDNLSHLERIF